MHDPLPSHVQLGQLMRAVRAHLGRSQHAVAHRMGCTRQHLSSFENGRTLPIPETWARWLEAVGAATAPVPGGDEWLDALVQRSQALYAEAAAAAGGSWGGGTAGSLETSATATAEDPDVRRDTFLKLTTMTGGAMLAPASLASPQPVTDDSQVTTVRAITAAYRRLDATTPAADLVEAVGAHLQLITQLRHQVPAGPVRDRLAAAASEAAGFAGWLAFDTHQPNAARSHYHAAVSYAHAARDHALEAYMLGSMAAWTTAQGNGNEALQLTRKAEQALQVNASPIPRAWVAAMKASAYATMRHRDACLRALDVAEDTIASITPDTPPMWPWLYPLSPAKINGYRGTCAATLRLPEVGVPALHAALGALGGSQVKQRALLTADLASVRIDEGEVEEAARLTAEAFTAGTQTRSEKIIDRVRGLRRRLAPWKSTGAVRSLDERLLAAFLN